MKDFTIDRTESFLQRKNCLFYLLPILFFILLPSLKAQEGVQPYFSLPDPERCTSNDLDIISADLDLETCDCEEGTTVEAGLVLGVRNNTESLRTSFSFWAQLTITDPKDPTDPNDDDVTYYMIKGCEPEILPGSMYGPGTANPDNPPRTKLATFNDEYFEIYEWNESENDYVRLYNGGAPAITFPYECGTSLKMTNIYQAWTDASKNDNRTCGNIDSSKINPKCGIIPVLSVGVGLSASVSTTDVSCSGESDGSIEITFNGGEGPYSIYLDGDLVESGLYESDSPYTIEDLSGNVAGTDYDWEIRDSSSPDICIKDGTVTIYAGPDVSVDLTPFDETCDGLDDGYIAVSASSDVERVELWIYDETLSDYSKTTATLDASNNFVGLAPGSYRVKVFADDGQGTTDGCSNYEDATIATATNCSHLFPTGTDCSDYLDPTIVDSLVLEEVCLTVSNEKIDNATPGVFFFYGSFTAVKGSNIVTVDQEVPSGMSPFSVLNENNLWVYDSNCNSQKISAELAPNGIDWIITFRARDAGTFVVSVKYDSKSLIGTSAPNGTANYRFGIEGEGASYGSIAVRDCSPASSSIQATSIEEPITASLNVEVVDNDIAVYPNPFSEVINVKYDINYTSDVVIEIFDFGGNLLRTITDRGVSAGSVTSINVDFSIGANQMYVVRVSTDREQFVKQILSGK